VVGGAIAPSLNLNWMLYDSTYLLAALCHGVGVGIASRARIRPERTAPWLAAAYGGGLAAAGLIAWFAFTGRMPAFYLPDQGGTLYLNRPEDLKQAQNPVAGGYSSWMPMLETDRLVIRPFEYDDCDFLVELFNDPAFIRNVEDKGVRTPAQAALFLARGPMASYSQYGHGLYLVALRDSGRPIGMCGLLRRNQVPDVDLGYALLPAFWGQGYALEAAAAVVDFGRRSLGLRRVSALVAPDNARSVALLVKLGFSFAQWLRAPDGSGTVAVYSLRIPTAAAGG
jgi:RimJ/RimL family protein N-acetyltransferase